MKKEFETIPAVSILANYRQQLTQGNAEPGSEYWCLRKREDFYGV